MSSAIPAARLRAATQPVLRRIAVQCRRIAERIERAARRAAARRDFHHLDAATLRDLGMSRSEHDSYRAEAEGLVEQTRLRVLQSLDRKLGS
ncbi:hypothetical protein [Piscinibacter sp.]|uniref:hypothetical protein n=1 Tax=Piscinibacter sp. TaxID=1903157 RepID=UPI002C6B58BA|nr:hypothetical protein [Albitalea sp.]HUG21853.1 hypothetical protein [Albitalea sp.]